jgi:S1-C subfamily serine protease
MRVNGERVADVEGFYRRLWAQPLNQPLELSVWRNGTLETVIARPRERAAPVSTPSP